FGVEAPHLPARGMIEAADLVIGRRAKPNVLVIGNHMKRSIVDNAGLQVVLVVTKVLLGRRGPSRFRSMLRPVAPNQFQRQRRLLGCDAATGIVMQVGGPTHTSRSRNVRIDAGKLMLLGRESGSDRFQSKRTALNAHFRELALCRVVFVVIVVGSQV